MISLDPRPNPVIFIGGVDETQKKSFRSQWVTKRGRVYKPEELEDPEDRERKGKGILIREPSKKKRFTKSGRTYENIQKKQVFSSRATEKTTTSPDFHIVFSALLKILKEFYVPENIDTKDLKHMVGQVTATNTITLLKMNSPLMRPGT